MRLTTKASPRGKGNRLSRQSKNVFDGRQQPYAPTRLDEYRQFDFDYIAPLSEMGDRLPPPALGGQLLGSMYRYNPAPPDPTDLGYIIKGLLHPRPRQTGEPKLPHEE